MISRVGIVGDDAFLKNKDVKHEDVFVFSTFTVSLPGMRLG